MNKIKVISVKINLNHYFYIIYKEICTRIFKCKISLDNFHAYVPYIDLRIMKIYSTTEITTLLLFATEFNFSLQNIYFNQHQTVCEVNALKASVLPIFDNVCIGSA